MTDVCAPFRGKQITLLGLGLLGRGVGDAVFLASCGAVLTVTDTKTEAQLSESVSKLKHLPNVTLHLGGHQMDDFTHADLIVKAPRPRRRGFPSRCRQRFSRSVQQSRERELSASLARAANRPFRTCSTTPSPVPADAHISAAMSAVSPHSRCFL